MASHSCLAFLGWWARNSDGPAERGPVPARGASQTLVRSAGSSARAFPGFWEGHWTAYTVWKSNFTAPAIDVFIHSGPT